MLKQFKCPHAGPSSRLGFCFGFIFFRRNIEKHRICAKTSISRADPLSVAAPANEPIQGCLQVENTINTRARHEKWFATAEFVRIPMPGPISLHNLGLAKSLKNEFGIASNASFTTQMPRHKFVPKRPTRSCCNFLAQTSQTSDTGLCGWKSVPNQSCLFPLEIAGTLTCCYIYCRRRVYEENAMVSCSMLIYAPHACIHAPYACIHTYNIIYIYIYIYSYIYIYIYNHISIYIYIILYYVCRDMQLDSNLMQPGSRLAYGWKDDTGVDPIRVSRPRLPHNYLAMSALDGLRLDVSNVRHATNLDSDKSWHILLIFSNR